MLRVLTLSTLFPNPAQPTLGLFVQRQTEALAARPGVAVEAVAPIGLPLWPLSLHPHYRPRARLAPEGSANGLLVHRPRFTVWPKLGEAGAAKAMAAALLPQLQALRRRFPFDVIDAEFFWPDGPAAMLLARSLGVPFSIKARGADIDYWGRRPGIAEQLLAAARSANGLLAVSRGLRQTMIELGMPGNRIQVHHTGVDSERFRPVDRAAAKARLGVSGPLIVTAGALIPRKGQAIALSALAQLPEATLLLVGDGPDRAELEALARRLGVTGRARFLGARPHDELAALFAAADVTLQPSASEGLANVWVESLACGTPVVTTEVAGADEVFDGPEAGRLVARDAEAMAEAVRGILADPPSPDAVRATALRFSWERNAEELERHLAGLAGQARRAA